MTKSIFIQQLDQEIRKKKTTESKMHEEILKARDAFANQTGMDKDDIAFLQEGIKKNIDELIMSSNVMAFIWVISLRHEACKTDLFAPVYASVPFSNDKNDVVLGVGEFKKDANFPAKNEFIDLLTSHFLNEINIKVSTLNTYYV